jgi:2,3-bisphosphoglycerate-independent phosphoglycerate mutase
MFIKGWLDMSFKNITSLLTPANTKIVMLIMDGLGGMPMVPGGLTELETAKTPNMDHLAAEGMLGQTLAVDFGIATGSGPAHLALFGYDPVAQEVGRGVLEALGVGLPVQGGDIAARGNFCTLDAAGNITDRRAGRIATEEAAPLIEKLKSIQLPGVTVDVRQVADYRFALVMRGEGLSADLTETDPLRTGVPPLPVVAQQPSAEQTAQRFNQWIEEGTRILSDHPKANCLTLRGFGMHPRLASFKERYDLRAACVAVYSMYKGIASLVGMDVIQFDGEQPEDEFKAVEQAWHDYDFFFVHIKHTDSYAEDGDFDRKVGIIEEVDRALPQLLKLKPDVLIITGDHSSPAKLKTHTWHPVPFLLSAPMTVRPDDQAKFGERACARGGLGTIKSLDAMPLALAHALRLSKFGP